MLRLASRSRWGFRSASLAAFGLPLTRASARQVACHLLHRWVRFERPRGVFVIVILVLLLGAFRELFLRAHFARAGRRGDSDVIEAARTGLGDGELASDAWGRSIKAHLESETSARTRSTREPTTITLQLVFTLCGRLQGLVLIRDNAVPASCSN